MNDPRSEIPESPQSPEAPETPDPTATSAPASPADSGDDSPQPQPIEPEPPEPPESPPPAPAEQSPTDLALSAPEPEPPADRPGWGARLRSGRAMFVYVVALVGSLITIWAYVEFKLDDGAIDTSLIRARLLASVDATYEAQRADAEAIVGDWQAREQALEAAKTQRDAQLARIDDLAEEIKRVAVGPEAEGIAQSLARILQDTAIDLRLGVGVAIAIAIGIERGTAIATSISSIPIPTAVQILKSMAVILQEQGPSAALGYIETKRGGIVARIRERRAANRARDREELKPLLASAGLYAAEGEAQSARERYAEVVALAPDWPEALDAHRWFLIDQGDLAVIRGTLDPAERDFALARQRVDALIALEPDEPRWQRNLGLCLERTGDLKVARGDLDGAQQAFERDLAIAERLAAAEPGNAGWQRDLAVSHFKLGRVADARDDEPALARHWGAMLAIFDALDQAGLHISPSDRAGLQGIRARVEAVSPAAATEGD